MTDSPVRLSFQPGLTVCLLAGFLSCPALLQDGLLQAAAPPVRSALSWNPLAELPDPLGVAGPFAGVHQGAGPHRNGVLIVAGGANFTDPQAPDLWTTPKRFHNNAWILTRDDSQTDRQGYRWSGGFRIDRPIGYGASISTPHGVVCIGGRDDQDVFDSVFLLSWDADSQSLRQTPLPPLPEPSCHNAAAMIGQTLYVVGGMNGPNLSDATRNMWSLDFSLYDQPERQAEFVWKPVLPWPGCERAFPVVVSQHNGFAPCLYVMSGRRTEHPGESNPDTIHLPDGDTLIPLTDVYEFCPSRYDPTAYDALTGRYHGSGEKSTPWRRRADAPFSFMAGTGAAVGQSHIFILSGSDGSRLREVFEQHRIPMSQYRHPGFPRRTLAYHTITDTWTEAGVSPANPVTTPAVKWDNDILLISGEIRPRVRTTRTWRITPTQRRRSFGTVNFTVLAAYLLAMVAVGLYFAQRNRNTDDFFRGGQKIPWWVAGCSIFATMLSSITFMAIPAKAYAQDLVYLPGNLMIFAVAPVAVYLALPFFRRIDATSAYEYLHRRFNLPVRLFASGSFTLFHIFRMGIVMSLAALALSTIADFSAGLSWLGLAPSANANAMTCVIIMGVLSIAYCTLGGVEAVVWTDTIQTIVLLGGALLCLCLMLSGSDGGLIGLFTTALADGKFHCFNLHWDPSSANLALWVVLIGGIGQNLSSYTADQAVVQRYMTTPSEKKAARAIWTNAWMCIPSSLLFYGVGTALYCFYKAHPDKLDPTYMTDQVFPLFIADEVPVGIAGLIVAGIFAAAQSTISTSMNSTATTVVTDFLRPFHVIQTETGYLQTARWLTFTLGVLGTALGLLFVSPDIKSLFDQFIKVIGLFMGVLGGLFCLGILTRRANGWGALTGALAGAAVMGLLPLYTRLNGYLYATIGIAACFIVGYLVSLVLPAPPKSKLAGLTLYTLKERPS